MKVLLTHLTIEQWRIVVHIGYLHSEGADALKTGITLIGCLHSHWDKFTIITLTIEDFVCRDFTSLFVHGEFCAFLIRLLYNGVFNLAGCDRNMQNYLMIDTKLIIALRRCPQNTTCNSRHGPNSTVHWTWAWHSVQNRSKSRHEISLDSPNRDGNVLKISTLYYS